MDIKKKFNPFTLNFAPYTPIEPPQEIAERLGIPVDKIIKMDANENPFGVPQSIKNEVASAQSMHIYPDPAQRKIRSLISGYTNLPINQIVAGNGSDELLDLICRMFLKPGDTVLSFSPTFSYYSHVIKLNRANFEQQPLTGDFRFDMNAVKKLNLSKYNAVFLCSPNNPTGMTVPAETAEYFLKQDNLPVIIDEAYYEYAGITYIDWLKRYPNLIIIRTFSKFFALAGFRVGYGLMHPDTAAVMLSIKPPYSVSVPSEVALEECFKNINTFRQQAEEIKLNRAYLISELNTMDGLTAYPSESNFFLCHCNSIRAGILKERLEQQGIIIRYYASDPVLRDFVRITVGTKLQCEHLLNAVKEILKTTEIS